MWYKDYQVAKDMRAHFNGVQQLAEFGFCKTARNSMQGLRLYYLQLWQLTKALNIKKKKKINNW